MMIKAEFVKRARAKHGEQFDYSVSQYVGYAKPVALICCDHGFFKTTPKSHLHTKSGGCAECRAKIVTKSLRCTTEEFVERARKVHGDRYEYHLVDYTGTLNKVVIVCPKHGPFRMTPTKHIGGQGCRKCAFERIGRERRLSFWDFVERVILAHGAGRYDYELKNFVNAHSKIPIRCQQHGTFYQSVATHIKGHGCPRCVQSAGEQKIREVLSALGVDFSEQVRFNQCRDKRALPFDFYVPNHRLLIEFDGRQHYENSELWGGDEKLAETQHHDALKDRFAERHGYRLLRIPHWESDNIDSILCDQLAQTEEFCVEDST